MALASTPKPIATPADAHQHDRGRHATTPSELKKDGWLDVLSRTKQQLDEDNLSIVGAGVAFFAFVAVVPALAATIALYGLIADNAQIASHLEALARIVPGEVMPLLQDQMTRIVTNTKSASISAFLGIAIALYSSANATKALINGLNIAYNEKEKRSFIRLNLFALGLTLCGIAGVLVAVTLLAVLPALLGHLNLGPHTALLISWARWPILVGGFMAALAVLYRYAPSRQEAKWKWVSWGAGVAAGLWVLGSALFSLYVRTIGSYDKTYGSLGAVVVFLFWIYLSAYVVLVGAELNSEMERQTLRDTTEGQEKPLGQRGARAADTVGPARDELKKK